MLDDFYQAKFDENGELRPGWSYVPWIQELTANWPKTPSPDVVKSLAGSSSQGNETHAVEALAA
jgi:hypothetical protein